LLGLAALCMGLYGFVMGSFAGGGQFWAVPVKATAGLLFAAALCLPSLYIFAGLAGARQTFAQTAWLLAAAVALAALLMAGFAPIAWVFTQSTRAASFMGALHLLFWATAVAFALRLLTGAFRFLNDRAMGVVALWGVLFLVVTLQVATALRPLVGPFDGWQFHERTFFLTHWANAISRDSK
jgi:hypothetical protein